MRVEMLGVFSNILKRVARQGGRVWVVLLFFAMTSGSAFAQTWTWTIESVDKSAKFTSLGVDPGGSVHVSYTDNSSHVLRYAFRSAESSRWFTLELDRNLQNVVTHLTLDSQGNPHICYPDWGTLKYAHWTGQRWVIQEISPGGAKEYTCSIAISPDGTPFVSWYQTRAANGLSYYHIRTAFLRDGAWLARTIDYDGEAGKWNSTVLDKQGQPYVSYSIFPTGELKLAHWDGKDWNISFIDSVNRDLVKAVRGMGNCMRFDPQGRLAVSYAGEKDVRYAVLQGDRWIYQKVDEVNFLGSWVGYLTGLDYDRAGRPHISYDDNGALKHAYWDGSLWHIQLIAMAGTEPYRYSSLGIAPDDTVYISYRDPQDSSLKVAVGRPAAPPPAMASTAPPKEGH
jgi:hypothetical protein